MLTRAERGMLAGAWMLIAAAGAAGTWKISRIPALDPDTVRTLGAVRQRMKDAAVEPPPPLKPMASWSLWSAEAAPAPLYGATLLPRMLPRTLPLPIRDREVQPWAAVVEATGSLDGISVTWTLARAAVTLESYERPKDVKPTGLRIQRSTDGKEWMDVATLAPDARTWMDAEAAPRMSYAYRVIVDAPLKAKAAAQGGSVAEARTPPDTRARLIGGDAKVAILRVETYNRKSRMWTGRERTARPGDELWPGGWKLTGLRFKGFGLVAEAVVEDGRPLELRTRD